MFTLFDPEFERFARETVSRHMSFDRGEWTTQSIRLHQQEELRRTLRHVVDGSPFYSRHLHKYLGLIESIGVEDIGQLPFTTKEDLRAAGTDMLSQPVKDGWIFYETTGTTGRATPCPRSNTDSIATNTALTVNYASVLGAHPGQQFVGVMGPTELHSTGDAFGEVFRNLGHCVAKMWPHSPVVGYRRAIEVMREFGITALVCTPGMAMSLAREAIQLGLSPAADFDLSFIMVVGELVTPALLRNVASIWSTEVYNCMYASQEASILAAVSADHSLRSIPLNNMYEVIDPDSGAQVLPNTTGVREGELVITHLFQGCKPLIRYRTGDVVRLAPPVPGSSYPSDTIVPLGRARDRTVIGDRTFHGYELEEAVLARVDGCCGYQIVIDRINGEDAIEVVLEFIDPATATPFTADAVRGEVRDQLGIDPVVRIGRIGTIATTGAMVSWKASRVQDMRAPDDPERQAALAIAAQRDGAR